MNAFYIFTLLIFIKVKSNSLDIFSRISIRIIYRVSIFIFFIIVLILVLSSLLIVSNNNNIVYRSFNSDKFNRLRFLFI